MSLYCTRTPSLDRIKTSRSRGHLGTHESQATPTTLGQTIQDPAIPPLIDTMETLQQLAKTASKTLWGDDAAKSGEEPISGRMGNVEAGEPYDAGNIGGS